MRFKTNDLFTVILIVALAGALVAASSWILRASLIVLVLGSVGLVLASIQLFLDCRNTAPASSEKKLLYEIPSFDDPDPQANWRGSLEIWAWLIGLIIAVRVIGLPLALPVFVFLYAKAYGASWLLAAFLSLLIAGFIYGVYEQIMHVYWPESVLGNLWEVT